MNIQNKARSKLSHTSSDEAPIKRSHLPDESDSKRMSEWLRKRGEIRIPFKRSIK